MKSFNKERKYIYGNQISEEKRTEQQKKERKNDGESYFSF